MNLNPVELYTLNASLTLPSGSTQCVQFRLTPEQVRLCKIDAKRVLMRAVDDMLDKALKVDYGW